MKKTVEAAATATLATPHTLGYRMPAEWEPHAATWLAWPHEPRTGPENSTHPVGVRGSRRPIARRRTHPRHRLGQARRGARQESVRELRRVAQAGGLRAPRHGSLLDTRFLAARFGQGPREKRETALVKWKFNGWARYKNHRARTNKRGSPLHCSSARRSRYQRRKSGANARAGAGRRRHRRRRRRVAARDRRVFARRAPGAERALGKAGMEAVLRDHLGAERVLCWSAALRATTQPGHIDDFARFVAPGKSSC